MMNIYLQYLGRRQQMALLQWRVSFLNSQSSGWRYKGNVAAFQIATSNPGAAPRLGLLGRLWARGTNSSPEVAAAGLDAMRGQTYGMVYGMTGGSLGFWTPAIGLAASGQYAIAIVMAGMGAVMSGVGIWMPGYWLKRVCRSPISIDEIEALQTFAPDDLEQGYLRLVADAVRQAVAPDAAEQVRAALRAVGEAIERLPAIAVPRASVDTLRAEAAQALAASRAETDPVVAASHERRADALERSASGAQRSQMLIRRAAALREEMTAQVESLRLGLAGFETTSGDVTGLTSLADAVRTVAEEAVSAADARTELESFQTEVPTAAPVLKLRPGG